MYINRNFMSDVKNIIKNALGQDLVLKLKTLLSEQVAQAPSPAPTPVVEAPVALSAEVVLNDGSKVTYDGEKLDVGVAVKKLNEDGSSAELMDGEYELADGSKMNVKGGLVVTIEAPMTDPEPAPAPAMDMEQRLEALEAKLNQSNSTNQTLLSKLEAVEQSYEKTKSDLKLTLEIVDKIIETPAAEPITGKVKSYEEMTNHEKMLFNKGKL